MNEEIKRSLTNLDLLLDQKKMLDLFLSNGNLSQAEYDTTLKSLLEQMHVTGEMVRKAENLKLPIFDMYCNPDNFAKIKSGKKVIDLRLQDEKRKRMKVGDIITFTEAPGGDFVKGIITAFYTFPTFKELYQILPAKDLGLEKEEDKNPQEMNNYYNDNEQKEYGVVGIRFRLI